MRKLLLILTLFTATVISTGAQSVWEEMEQHPAGVSVERTDTADYLEITVKDGYVYVTTSKPVTIKIFSILGQLISQKQIPAGTSRTHITARGIYILKAGTTTKRITI